MDNTSKSVPLAMPPEQQEPDIRLHCKLDSRDYLDVFLGETAIVFKAYYHLMEETALNARHTITLEDDKVSEVIAFLKNDESQRSVFAVTVDARIDFKSLSKGDVGVELRIIDEPYQFSQPLLAIRAASVKALLCLLRAWHRKEVPINETPLFGLG